MSFFAVRCPDGFEPVSSGSGLVCSNGSGSSESPGFQVLDLAVIASNPSSEIDPALATDAVVAGLTVGVGLFGTVFAIRTVLRLISQQ